LDAGGVKVDEFAEGFVGHARDSRRKWGFRQRPFVQIGRMSTSDRGRQECVPH
jgi:hypothetical protein